MENIRKQAKKTLIIYIAVLIASIVLWVFFNVVEIRGGENNSSNFGRVFCVGEIAFMAVNIARYSAALKSDEKLKRLYISVTDEREKLICEKSDSSSFKAILCIIVLSAMVASFYSDTVFYTLIGVMMTIIFVKAGFRFYYRRKF